MTALATPASAAARRAPAGFDPAIFQDFGDIFGDFFGFGDMFGQGGRRRSRAQRGADLREDLNLEFEEAVFGAEKQVSVRRHETCESCRGIGRRAGESSGDLPVVQWARAGAVSARLFQHCADVSDLPGSGQRDHRSLPEMQG